MTLCTGSNGLIFFSILLFFFFFLNLYIVYIEMKKKFFFLFDSFDITINPRLLLLLLSILIIFDGWIDFFFFSCFCFWISFWFHVCYAVHCILGKRKLIHKWKNENDQNFFLFCFWYSKYSKIHFCSQKWKYEMLLKLTF